jgi:CelD/BcsL family acetyltransferase involved in cellulose biosynthesis
MHSRVIDSVDELTALLPEWQDLRERALTDSPFVSPDWLLPWWRAYGRERDRLHVIVTRSTADGPLTGVLPMYMQPARRPLPHRRLRLIGDQYVGSSDLGCLADAEAAGDVFQALADRLVRNEDGWDILDLKCVNSGNPFVTQLIETSKAASLHCRRGRPEYAPYSELPGTWEEFLAMLSHHMRSKVRRTRRRLEGTGTVVIERGDAPGALADAIPAVVGLFEENIRRRFGPDFQASDSYRLFIADVMERFMASGQLELTFINVEGVRIAFALRFRVRDTLWAYQMGFDRDWSHMSAGTIVAGYSIERGIDEGLTHLDWGPPPGNHKSQWAASGQRRIDSDRIYASSPAGAAIDAMDWIALRSRSLAKRILPQGLRERMLRPLRKRRLSKH